MENLLFEGSVDKRLATCAAGASNPSKSPGASSEISPTSNPDKKCLNQITLSLTVEMEMELNV